MTRYVPPTGGKVQVSPADLDHRAARALEKAAAKRARSVERDRASQAGLAVRAAMKLRHIRISGKK